MPTAFAINSGSRATPAARLCAGRAPESSRPPPSPPSPSSSSGGRGPPLPGGATTPTGPALSRSQSWSLTATAIDSPPGSGDISSRSALAQASPPSRALSSRSRGEIILLHGLGPRQVGAGHGAFTSRTRSSSPQRPGWLLAQPPEVASQTYLPEERLCVARAPSSRVGIQHVVVPGDSKVKLLLERHRWLRAEHARACTTGPRAPPTGRRASSLR